MSVSEQDVRHIAALARLAIDDARIAVLVGELNGILRHMDVLQHVDMTGAAALAPVVALAASPLREDVAGSMPLHHERSEFAPVFRDGFFLVPRLATHE